MVAVELRLCDEDREKFGGPEWVRFDEKDLDDLDLEVLNRFESELNVSLDFLLLVDKPSSTVRWKAAMVWMGRQIAGVQTPELQKFLIKVRRMQIRDEPKPKRTAKAKAGDADPPSSSPSSEAEASETVSE